MTDRPIIFSAPMVRALLEGRKTQTRRLASSPLAKVRSGDRLWVRESMKIDVGRETLTYAADNAVVPRGSFAWQAWLQQYGGNAVPSIHMPRWASRLTLIVEAVKVEPLQRISDADAVAEGIERLKSGRGYYDPTLSHAESRGAVHAGRFYRNASHAFAALWDHLHGPGAWSANPDVVALTFRVVRANIDSPGAAA